MKLTARIPQNHDIFDRLIQRGIKSRIVKDGIIIELPEIGLFTYHIPLEAAEEPTTNFYIDVAEQGGAGSTSGIVVAGYSGKKLRPYYVPRAAKMRACDVHAKFAVQGKVITVKSWQRSTEVLIQCHKISPVPPEQARPLTILTEEIWKGNLYKLPTDFLKYTAAAEAAVVKANCMHCRHAHYTSSISKEIVV